MEVIRGTKNIKKKHQHAIAVLGFFDGFHRGHQALIDEAKQKAGSFSPPLPVLLYTFNRHPLEIINPPLAPKLLCTLDEKIKLAEQFCVDYFLVEKFDGALSQMEHDFFLRRVVSESLKPEEVVVGFNYRYGKNRHGNIETLLKDAPGLGFKAAVVKPIKVKSTPVSSSLIRQLLTQGKVEQVVPFLGRRYSLEGRVVRGKGRGKDLGVPTANLDIPPRKLIPAPGIYAVIAQLKEKTYAGVASIGNSPTFNGQEEVTEVHLFDFNQDVYGETLALEFAAWRRPQERFSSVEALVSAMKEDLAWRRHVVGVIPRGRS